MIYEDQIWYWHVKLWLEDDRSNILSYVLNLSWSYHFYSYHYCEETTSQNKLIGKKARQAALCYVMFTLFNFKVMPFISKVMEDQDSFGVHGHSDRILLLLIKGVHCLEKWELKIPAFCLISVINCLYWKKGRITGIFLLFRKVRIKDFSFLFNICNKFIIMKKRQNNRYLYIV